ncbi:MAG: DUF4142 domain-containing protein [Gemmatimonadaceae bacterium]
MNPSTRHLFAAVGVMASIVTVPSLKAQTPAPAPRTMTGHASADSAQSLVNFITMINRDEIAAGQLAMSKSARADVKEYARRMVEDHTNLQAAWVEKVPALSLTIPDSGSTTPKPMMAKTGTAAMANGVSEVRDTTTKARGGVGAAAIHSANASGLEDLRKLNGSAFDSLYVQMQLDGQDAVLKELALRPITYTELQTPLIIFRTTVENHQIAAKKLNASR